MNEIRARRAQDSTRLAEAVFITCTSKKAHTHGHEVKLVFILIWIRFSIKSRMYKDSLSDFVLVFEWG